MLLYFGLECLLEKIMEEFGKREIIEMVLKWRRYIMILLFPHLNHVYSYSRYIFWAKCFVKIITLAAKFGGTLDRIVN